MVVLADIPGFKELTLQGTTPKGDTTRRAGNWCPYVIGSLTLVITQPFAERQRGHKFQTLIVANPAQVVFESRDVLNAIGWWRQHIAIKIKRVVITVRFD